MADRFAFADNERTLITTGAESSVRRAACCVLADGVDGLFDRGSSTSDGLIVGVLPFDRRDDAYLIRPAEARWEGADALPGSKPTWSTATLRADPPSREYERVVREAVELLRRGGDLEKVVLARTLVLEADSAIDPFALAARLRVDRGATTFVAPLPPAADGRERLLVGASPELLVEKRGRSVVSFPLAGSAARRIDPVDDRRAAEALAQSAKDAHEHALVVEWIADTLAPFCRSLVVPKAPSLVATHTMWHLATRIEGELGDLDVSSLALAHALHPTPAVCGTPRERARDLIASLEPFDRGYYTGAVGWCDARGDGRWMVAIRCAEVSGKTARLFAGAGIVPASDPRAELLETTAKFGALARAFGVSADVVDE